MAGKKIGELTPLGRNLISTDELELSLVGSTGSRKITGAQLTNGLQPTLFSGTNIKTINSTSILGSGNLVVSGGGGLQTIVKPLSGSYAYQAINSTDPFNNYSMYTANYISLAPYSPSVSFSINQMSTYVLTSVASEEVKLLIYSDVNGIPTTNLLTSTAISCATTGFKTFTTSFTFAAGTKYWIGLVNKTGGGAILNSLYKDCYQPIAFDGQGQAFIALSSSAYTYATPPTTITSANVTLEYNPFFPTIGLRSV